MHNHTHMRAHTRTLHPPTTDAKGMVPEDHAHFIGLYWGPVSWPCVCEVCVGGRTFG